MVKVLELLWKYRMVGVAGLGVVAAYCAYAMPGLVANPTILVLLIGVQVLLVAISSYRRVFFFVVMIFFLLAGVELPFKGVWGAGRWAVLLCAGVVGMTLWLKESRQHFSGIHLAALFCIASAMASASVSAFPRTAFLKASSLLLLFAYAASGARLAQLNREWQFPRDLVTACEVIVYVAALSYFAVRLQIFGNPNSLGAVMGVAVVPLLAWGVLDANTENLRRRRILSFALGVALLLYSRSRAGLLAGLGSTSFLLLNLKSYRLFVRAAMIGVTGLALIGLWAPGRIGESAADVNENLVYKGHRGGGLLASRRGPWEATMATIREHPFFGGGFGTTQTGADGEKEASAFATTNGTAREHGNSYLALLEWVGLLGILPFVLLGACSWRFTE
jgi:O-antigen ligase